jgi:alpha-tubulin suppressor-like RCC1 family protein
MGLCRAASPVLVGSLVLMGCGNSDGTGPGSGDPVASVAVAPDATTITTLLETLQFSASAHNASGDTIPSQPFEWSSSKVSVATVSPSGLVTPRANGSATITATSGGRSATAEVLVNAVATPMRFATMSVGATHACGITVVGQPYCWGENRTGPLGDSTLTLRREPVPVKAEYTYRSVAGGLFHTCAVTTRSDAYCWGEDATGQLGNGTDTGPEQCSFACRTTPVLVSGGFAFQSVDAGGGHTCGVTLPGRGYCWGENSHGQLGAIADTGGDACVFSCSTRPVGVAGGLTFRSVLAGFTHSCGVTTTGQGYCWGDNTFGQVGDGTITERHEPVPVAGGLTFNSLSTGNRHTCALTTSGAAYCWGDNAHGQLGDNTVTTRNEPALVGGGLTFESIGAGGSHTCAITGSGQLYCWGWNNFGQLGDGTRFTERHEPVPVAGGLVFQSAYPGDKHSCGLTTAGQPYCWGRNGLGQLGDGTGAQSSVPMAVAGPE